MTTEAQRNETTPAKDLYTLDPAEVREPPRTFTGRVRHLGPGMVISAAVIGSGELIVTTALGAQAGFALLWLVIVSTLVKVWVQLELAQWTILTGKTSLEGYSQIGPRWRGLSTINLVWIVTEIPKLIQRGGIIGGVAAAMSLAAPVAGAPLSSSSLGFWTVVSAAIIIALVYTNRYGLIERIATVAILALVTLTVVLALGLSLTPFSYGGADIAEGLSFGVPAGSVGIAVAMFGLTGFAAAEINTYGYWCIEKGYARWTGPDDGSEQRAQRAEGWLRVMRLDTFVAWAVCTVCTLSFYIIGAAVLNPQNLVPEGNEVITTLSRMYTDTLGEWAGPLFLVVAVLTLGSTLLAVGAGSPRLWANTLGLIGLINWRDARQRNRTIRIIGVILPILWGISFFAVQEPVLMVQIGGIGDGLLLAVMVLAVWRLRITEVPPRFKASPFFTAALAVSSVAIVSIGAVTLLEVFGVTWA